MYEFAVTCYIDKFVPKKLPVCLFRGNFVVYKRCCWRLIYTYDNLHLVNLRYDDDHDDDDDVLYSMF